MCIYVYTCILKYAKAHNVAIWQMIWDAEIAEWVLSHTHRLLRMLKLVNHKAFKGRHSQKVGSVLNLLYNLTRELTFGKFCQQWRIQCLSSPTLSESSVSLSWWVVTHAYSTRVTSHIHMSRVTHTCSSSLTPSTSSSLWWWVVTYAYTRHWYLLHM